MVFVNHRSNPIEPVAVYFELLHPIPDVRQEKALDFILGVVENSTVPLSMKTMRQCVEVVIISPIPHVGTLDSVLDCMCMDQID